MNYREGDIEIHISSCATREERVADQTLYILARFYDVRGAYGMLTSRYGARRRRGSKVWQARRELAQRGPQWELARDFAEIQVSVNDRTLQLLLETEKIPFTSKGLDDIVDASRVAYKELLR